MEIKGTDKYITIDGLNHYAILKKKRDAILKGVPYKINDITVQYICCYGGLITTLNIYQGGKFINNKELIQGIIKSLNETAPEILHKVE